MSIYPQDRALESDRAFMEEWCFISGSYARSFYAKLTDDELEAQYEHLTGLLAKEKETAEK